MTRLSLNSRINTPRLHELRKKRRKSTLSAQAALLEKSSLHQDDQQKPAAAEKRLNSRIRAYTCTLAAEHHTVFNRDSPVPLKIGIRADLRRAYPQFSNKVNNIFLKRWCNTARYKSVLIPGAARYDLHGVISGDVTEAEVEHLK